MNLSFGCSVCFGHSLNRVLMLRYCHDRNTDDFSYPFSQVLIARRHDVAFMLRDSLNDTIVGVRALVQTGKTLESRVFCDSQRDSIRLSELFQLGHHAVCNVRHAFCVQTVHHWLYDVEFVFDREVDEVCVDDDVKGRAELGVVAEEERTRCFWSW